MRHRAIVLASVIFAILLVVAMAVSESFGVIVLAVGIVLLPALVSRVGNRKQDEQKRE